MEMSINRALSELKLITKKINDKTARLEVCAASKTQGLEEVAKKAFVEKAKGDVQSLKDLIAQRNKIKSAIVLSNAMTKVVIGNITLTVAEAIERKTSIELEKNLNRKIREHYYTNKTNVERHNEQAKQQANAQVSKALGADTEGDKGAAAKAIFDSSYDVNKAELLSIDGIELMIENDQDKIDEFESEVDFILSESNTKTTITI